MNAILFTIRFTQSAQILAYVAHAQYSLTHNHEYWHICESHTVKWVLGKRGLAGTNELIAGTVKTDAEGKQIKHIGSMETHCVFIHIFKDVHLWRKLMSSSWLIILKKSI